MKWTLGKKFLITSVLFMAASFLLIAAGGTLVVRRHLLDTKVKSMTGVGSALVSVVTDQMAESGVSSLTPSLFSDQEPDEISTAFSLTRSIDEYTVWLIGTDGLVLSATDDMSGSTISFNPAVKGKYIRGVYNSFFLRDTITVYSPVIPSGTYQPCGYVLVHYPYSAITRSKNLILNRFFLLWGFCAALWLVFVLVLHRIVYVPIQRMLHAAEQCINDNSPAEFSIRTTDEIGALSGILNRIFERFRTINEAQRQFIANVSHDLRSPLTSIKGYVEAILDGTIPPDQQNRYLTIVLNETNRLTNLTQNLLTLNALDAGQEPLAPTRFDIHSVIRQVLLTFEQRCQKKEIRFQLTLEGKNLMVFADLLKIQQVLYNLIDNAIKFSPPGSVIEISTWQRYGKAFVSVRDHGEGIAAENLDKIWNRFYKTDPSRGLDKKGTGIGLALVHNIISLHRETIRVKSEPGKGSEFIFSLPLDHQ